MAGYRTVDELMDILEEECLEFDAVVSIVGGNNKYDYQVITVPFLFLPVFSMKRLRS